MEQWIIRHNGKYPAWGARRIKFRSNSRVPGERFIVFSGHMGFSFESNPNHNPQENGFILNMGPACGKVIPSSSESMALVKSASPGSPMIVPDTTEKAKSIFKKMLWYTTINFGEGL